MRGSFLHGRKLGKNERLSNQTACINIEQTTGLRSAIVCDIEGAQQIKPFADKWITLDEVIFVLQGLLPINSSLELILPQTHSISLQRQKIGLW